MSNCTFLQHIYPFFSFFAEFTQCMLLWDISPHFLCSVTTKWQNELWGYESSHWCYQWWNDTSSRLMFFYMAVKVLFRGSGTAYLVWQLGWWYRPRRGGCSWGSSGRLGCWHENLLPGTCWSSWFHKQEGITLGPKPQRLAFPWEMKRNTAVSAGSPCKQQ